MGGNERRKKEGGTDKERKFHAFWSPVLDGS
jgi:hypothetical protein